MSTESAARPLPGAPEHLLLDACAEAFFVLLPIVAFSL